MIRFALQMTLLGLAAMYAWNRGGKPEKIVATSFVSITTIDQTYWMLTGIQAQFGSVDLWFVFLDTVLLSVLLWASLRFDRWWLLFAAAFQLITTIGHIARALDLEMPELVYAILIRTLSYLLIFSLAVGTWQHARDQKRKNAQTS